MGDPIVDGIVEKLYGSDSEWTTTPPTEPGWYWRRTDSWPDPLPEHVPDPNFAKTIGGEWWPLRIPEPE